MFEIFLVFWGAWRLSLDYMKFTNPFSALDTTKRCRSRSKLEIHIEKATLFRIDVKENCLFIFNLYMFDHSVEFVCICFVFLGKYKEIFFMTKLEKEIIFMRSNIQLNTLLLTIPASDSFHLSIFFIFLMAFDDIVCNKYNIQSIFLENEHKNFIQFHSFNQKIIHFFK